MVTICVRPNIKSSLNNDFWDTLMEHFGVNLFLRATLYYNAIFLRSLTSRSNSFLLHCRTTIQNVICFLSTVSLFQTWLKTFSFRHKITSCRLLFSSRFSSAAFPFLVFNFLFNFLSTSYISIMTELYYTFSAIFSFHLTTKKKHG